MSKKQQSRVQKICTVESYRRRWVDKLDPEDQKLCEQVRDEVISRGLPMMTVGQALVDELKLPVNAQAVAKWFREAVK
jgi:hypothetical protein